MEKKASSRANLIRLPHGHGRSINGAETSFDPSGGEGNKFLVSFSRCNINPKVLLREKQGLDGNKTN